MIGPRFAVSAKGSWLLPERRGDCPRGHALPEEATYDRQQRRHRALGGATTVRGNIFTSVRGIYALQPDPATEPITRAVKTVATLARRLSGPRRGRGGPRAGQLGRTPRPAALPGAGPRRRRVANLRRHSPEAAIAGLRAVRRRLGYAGRYDTDYNEIEEDQP